MSNLSCVHAHHTLARGTPALAQNSPLGPRGADRRPAAQHVEQLGCASTSLHTMQSRMCAPPVKQGEGDSIGLDDHCGGNVRGAFRDFRVMCAEAYLNPITCHGASPSSSIIRPCHDDFVRLLWREEVVEADDLIGGRRVVGRHDLHCGCACGSSMNAPMARGSAQWRRRAVQSIRRSCSHHQALPLA